MAAFAAFAAFAAAAGGQSCYPGRVIQVTAAYVDPKSLSGPRNRSEYHLNITN
jgi:hypothetical protein